MNYIKISLLLFVSSFLLTQTSPTYAVKFTLKNKTVNKNTETFINGVSVITKTKGYADKTTKVSKKYQYKTDAGNIAESIKIKERFRPGEDKPIIRSTSIDGIITIDNNGNKILIKKRKKQTIKKINEDRHIVTYQITSEAGITKNVSINKENNALLIDELYNPGIEAQYKIIKNGTIQPINLKNKDSNVYQIYKQEKQKLKSQIPVLRNKIDDNYKILFKKPSDNDYYLNNPEKLEKLQDQYNYDINNLNAHVLNKLKYNFELYLSNLFADFYN